MNRTGLLSLASGSIDVPDESTSALLAANLAAARRFLIAGGTVTLTEWAALPDAERGALSQAGEELADYNALRLARAILRAQIDPAGAGVGGP